MFRIIRGLLFFTIGVFLFGWIVELLWNELIPEIFHGPFIGYWQSVGLLVLARLLFHGGHGFPRRRGRRGDRCGNRGYRGGGSWWGRSNRSWSRNQTWSGDRPWWADLNCWGNSEQWSERQNWTKDQWKEWKEQIHQKKQEYKERWNNMTPEEREKMKNAWRSGCWEEPGKTSQSGGSQSDTSQQKETVAS